MPPPVGDLQRLFDDPALARRLAVETTGCVHYLTMQMDAGPTRELAVRQAVNYAIDRQAVVLAIGGAYAGAPATTVLSPTLAGHSTFDLYPSQDAAGDPDKARELLAEAGYLPPCPHRAASPRRSPLQPQSRLDPPSVPR